MKSALGSSIAVLGLLMLVACSNRPPTPISNPETSDPKAAAVASTATPWDALKSDEQRARDVQKVVDKQAADQSKQIDDQSQ